MNHNTEYIDMKKDSLNNFSPAVLHELDIALQEMGELTPTWSTDYSEWELRHSLYPNIYVSDHTPEAAIERFKGHLCVFIEYRLKGKIDVTTEAETKGVAGKRGGRREGAGRKPSGGRGVRVSLPPELAAWIKLEGNLEKVKRMAMG
jgi:hypothetical protein